MRLYLIGFLSIFVSLSCNAQLSKQDQEYLKQQQDNLKEFKKDVQGFQYSLPNSQQERVSNEADNIKNNMGKPQDDDSDKFLYFVSFSIPDDGIIAMTKDAKSYGFTPVIRGLIDNDYTTTAKKVFKLTQVDKNFGVAIDPFYYREFNIKAVPALVVKCKQGYDVIYGSLPVKEDLNKILESGQCQNEAKELLAKR